jgi:hypothetical protein
MRRLENICLIKANRPEGVGSVPQAFVAKGWSGGKALRDAGSRRIVPWKNVPKGWNVVVGMVDTKYLLEPAFAFAYNPSGRFLC